MPEQAFDHSPGLVRMMLRGLVPHRSTPVLDDITLTLAGERPDPDRLAAYQRLCGLRVRAELPPTFPHVLAFPLHVARITRPDFPLPLLGLVHTDNSIRQHREIGLDEPLDIRVWAEDVREHPAGTQVDLLAEVRAGDELVWDSRSTYLHREKRPSAAKPSGAKPVATSAPEPFEAVIRVPRDTGRRYAAVSGDRNPIHLYPLTARAFGFARPIAHGMWLAARVLAPLDGRLPAAVGYDVTFKAAVSLPSSVAVHSRRTDEGWRLDVRNPRTGRLHLDGAIRL